LRKEKREGNRSAAGSSPDGREPTDEFYGIWEGRGREQRKRKSHNQDEIKEVCRRDESNTVGELTNGRVKQNREARKTLNANAAHV